MLTRSELIAMVTQAAVTIEWQETWDKPREFEEWLGIVTNPERVAPLRTIVRALAMAGEDAGMGLRLKDGVVHFFHRWQLVVARKN
jgi:hypothetical protein